MSRPYRPKVEADHALRGSLGPVDIDRMTEAAEDLRDRTMSLEPDEAPPPWRLAFTVIAVVFVVASLLIVYRRPLLAAVHVLRF